MQGLLQDLQQQVLVKVLAGTARQWQLGWGLQDGVMASVLVQDLD
jgi:hypothetical protein